MGANELDERPAAAGNDASAPGDVLLVFQGGGALGAFECGAYRVLADWLRGTGRRLVAVAGASIGAINAAIVARHCRQPGGGSAALDAFWHDVAAPAYPFLPYPGEAFRRLNGLLTGLLAGVPGLHAAAYANWNLTGALGRFRMPLHDTAPMERTLSRHVGPYPRDDPRLPLLLVRAVDVHSGAPAVFHSRREAITPRHLRACSALPLLFDPVELDGRWYWDGDTSGRTLLPDALATIERERLLEPPRPLLAILMNTVPRAAPLPQSGPQASFRLESLLLGGRADGDEAALAHEDGHLAFVERVRAQAAALPPGSLLRASIEAEHARLARRGRRRVALLRIDRDQLPGDHLSRGFDFRRERLAELAAQGERCARAALAPSTAGA